MGTQANSKFFVLKGVSKRFQQPSTNPFKKTSPVQALDSVDLEIARGKITCLLGPNGAGKTTLIKVLASLITPDSGEIFYEGVPIAQKRKELQAKISMVTPSERSFYWRLSGRENLEFYGRLYNFFGKALKARVNQVLDEVGMQDSADKPYRLYSAGMKQKVNIARALLGNPELYLLDEPASHLDPLAREEFRDFIEKTLVAQRGATVFLCTHDLEEAKDLGDQLVVLSAGRIVAQGRRQELLQSGGSQRELLLTYSGTLPEAWSDGLTVTPDPEEAGRLLVGFNPANTSPEDIIGRFVGKGGRLTEAVQREDSLLDFIKRITATDA